MGNRTASIDSSSIWFAQNLIWLLCSWAAWIGAVFASFHVGLAGLLVFALCVAAVTIALRLPVLTNGAHSDGRIVIAQRWMTQLIWLTGCLASLNWLGFLALSSLDLATAIPPIFVVLVAECWLHVKASECGQLPRLYRRLRSRLGWLFTTAEGVPGSSIEDKGTESRTSENYDPASVLAARRGNINKPIRTTALYVAEAAQAFDHQQNNSSKAHRTTSTEQFPQSERRSPTGESDSAQRDLTETRLSAVNGDLAAAANDDEPNENEVAAASSRQIVRQSVEGVDEDGHLYQSGELSVTFLPQQSMASAVITFCTAFAGTPSVDLEYEREGADAGLTADDLSIRPINTTPNGLRLTLRRSSAHEAATYKLLWYAHLDPTHPDSFRSVLP